MFSGCSSWEKSLRDVPEEQERAAEGDGEKTLGIAVPPTKFFT